MNRTGIIVAITTTTLLGVGGWYTRSWWWGSKPTAAKPTQQAEKGKAEEKAPALGESQPAARVAAAKIHDRYAGKPAARPRFGAEESLSSDEAESSEEKPARPSAKFSAKFTSDSENTSTDGADATTPTATDIPTAQESTETSNSGSAAADATSDPAVESGAEEKAEERTMIPDGQTAPAPVSNEPTEEEATPEEEPKPRSNPPRKLDTSRAPPLRSEEAEPTNDNTAQREVPEEEVVRIQEPVRAAKALPNHQEVATEDEPTTKRSLKVAQPMSRPPELEETPRMVSEAASPRAIGEASSDLTSFLAKSMAKPEEAPGDRRLEGEQSAPITLTKLAPSEVSVGRPAIFETRVRNSGSSVAHQVIVMDRVPRGARLIDATPKFTQTEEGSLLWELGSLDPGQEVLIKMQLMPEEEGEIGSVASASYQVKASSRTVSTRPQLQVEHTGPAKVLVGESVTFRIRIHNPGTGIARGVRIEQDVPRGLSHDEGRQLEYELGELAPGKTREVELVLTAAEAGPVTNVIHVRGEGDLQAEHTTQLEVLAPKIETEISGPKRRYLDRQATYSIRIANPGTAAARMVEFYAQLPTGMKHVSADNSGRYDARKHAVYWKIENLPAGQEGVVQLVVQSTSSGQQAIRVAAKADSGLESMSELGIVVEAAPETSFTVRDTSDPIEVGAESIYEIVVANNGTRADSQVHISANFPPEMQVLDEQGPAAHTIDGQRVVFEPLGKLDPKSEVTYKIKIRALSAAADPRVVKVQATSTALSTPVSREESTLIYEDR